MATYAIGDVQGCYDELIELLNLIHYDHNDQLWFVGDLVNRGPNSLAVLRFIRSLTTKPVIVLGNHDLHLLAVECGQTALRNKDTIEDVLAADDCDELCAWLRGQKLCHMDYDKQFFISHAGLAPQWSINQALNLAQEIETCLQSEEQYPELFKHMYGDKPDSWNEQLIGWERKRLIINYFTRMRFCDRNGRLNLTVKGGLDLKSPSLHPWFKLANSHREKTAIVFGHWAGLDGKTDDPMVHAIDTGCAWGKKLTAFRLEDKKRFSINAHQKVNHQLGW